MTEHDPLEIATIAELAHLPAEDHRVTEAMQSPRTRALLASYRDFLAQGPPPDGARVAEADAALAAVLEREMALPAGFRAQPRTKSHPSAWARLFSPALRPAWAMAGIVAIAALAWVALPHRGPAPERVMRGSESAALEASVARGASAAAFTWTAVPGADRYEVRIYATDLVTVLAVHEAGDATRWSLPGTEYPEALARGEGVAWQVTAYQGDTPIAQSRLQTLTTR